MTIQERYNYIKGIKSKPQQSYRIENEIDNYIVARQKIKERFINANEELIIDKAAEKVAAAADKEIKQALNNISILLPL